MSARDSQEIWSGFWELPQDPGAVWQMDLVLLPMWGKSEEGDEPRLEIAWTAFCLEVPGGAVGMSRFAPDPDLALGLDVLGTVARSALHRPRRIEVSDPALAGDLRAALTLVGSDGIEIDLRDELPELRRVFGAFRERIAGSALPGYLSVPGVTPEAVESFARAAARFFEAAPWRLFGTADMVEVEVRTEAADAPGIVWLSLLGKLSEKAVIAFEERASDDAETYEDEGDGIRREPEAGSGSRLPWVLPFLPPAQVPLDDLELWKRRGFPLARPEAYPILLRPREVGHVDTIERPEAGRLACFEGMLELLASVTEQEIDRGKIEREVATAAGPLRLILRVDGLPLDEEEVLEIAGSDPDPRVRAENLLTRVEGSSRRSMLLARRALGIWPDCAEAYVVLGDCIQEREAAVSLYLQGEAAGRRALGEELLRTEAGRLGEVPDATWYLTVLLRLGETLRELDLHEEAVLPLRELLRLDVLDGRKARYLLVDSLLHLDRGEELDKLFGSYRDVSAFWTWPQALLAFRREGDSAAARDLLQVALKGNRLVPRALLEPAPVPAGDFPLPRILPAGSREEALFYAARGHALWAATPGALPWLGVNTGMPLGVSRPDEHPEKGPKGRKKKRSW
jgi:tetratricopeptide (TPR) repeat protein